MNPSTQTAQPAAPAPAARPEQRGQLSPQKLEALRQYQAERLVIRGETEVHSGPVMVHTGVAWGPRWGRRWGPRWGPSTSVAVVSSPVFASRTWGIYQGPERLGVPTALSLAGDPRGDQIQQTINRRKRTASAWYTVAGAGGAAIVASLFGQLSAPDKDTYYSWQLVGLGGAGTAAIGMLAGSGPASDARSLERYPSRTLTATEARALVDRHNDSLRDQLGLSPRDVWEIERDQPLAR